MVVSSARAFFFRIPRPSQFINPYSFLYIPERFQGYHCYHGLSNNSKECASKGILYFKGWNNKMKAVNPVWRPISTQSTSNEGRVANDSTVSSSLQANNEVGVAEGVQVSHGSVAQNSFEVADAEKVSTASKEKIVVSVEVGASVMRFIGYKDKSLRQSIEEEMGVKLIFPLSKKEDSIVIEGDSMDAITKASEKIQAIIDKAVNSSALTFSHLISLPLAIHNELVDKLNRFQSTVLAYSDSKDADGTMDVDSSDEASEDEEKSVKPVNTPDVAANLKVDDIHNVKRDTKDIPLVSYAPKTSGLGIDKSIFIKPKRFHLTVVMLKLWNKGRVNAAKEVLQSISSELIEVLENRPLFIRLKGLDCLRGSRTKAQVLYAPVEEIGNEGRLHRACQLIIDAYVKAGLVLERDAKQKLKLHATVMNTTQRKGVNRRKHKRGKDSFDATPIFEQFGSEAWGDYLIREAHLSQRFLYDDNGYYHCCAAIPFPEIAEVPATSATPAESVEESIAESV
ncbi:uncharacterized protein LOC110729834 isoform X1 [Chenopodium quinoa]|uniref:uncharacterized protein LOC110729834 isoform X1 n=1 Tax=Chenopodium quinoa TaxID=63459 RepID=UPI000B78A654|nr:uncharacterized protein LOC110729834 isoform X1 [Chenopodium quinoa]